MGSTHIFKMHSFVELWHPFLFAVLLVVALAYFHETSKSRERNGLTEPMHPLRKVAFISGITLIYIAEGSPLQMIGHHYLFSVHMFNMSLTFISAPPLILVGLPIKWIRFVYKAPFFPVIKFLTRPLIALFLFNICISFFHFPFVFDFVMAHSFIMKSYDVVLLITGLIMWWPVASPLTDINKLNHLKKLAYIFAAGVLLTPACALIMFAKEPIYNAYLHVPRLWNVDLIDDQNSGGVIMKIMQEISYIIIMGFVFLQWTKEAKEQNKQEKIEYRGPNQDSFETVE